MTESTNSTTAHNTDENGDVLSADWFDALIKAEFIHAGFTPMSEEDNAWTLGRTTEEVSWYVNKHIHSSYRDSGRVFVMLVGATVNAGPSFLGIERQLEKPHSPLFPIHFNVFMFSPGIELGVPPEFELSFSNDCPGSEFYLEYWNMIMDLDSEMNVGERCRAVRELATRIGAVASQVATLDELREFTARFHMDFGTTEADTWLHPAGEYYHLSFADMRDTQW